MALNHTALPQDEGLPHYLQDGDPFASKLSWEADLVAGFYLTIIGILSTVGNGYVLYMSSRRKKKLRPAEIMTVNLAVCDLGISVVGKPFTIISCFCHRWVFGWIGCRWYGWAGFFFGCGSLITMTAVSLDRYLKICYLSYGVWLKRKHTYICLAFIWAYASFWTTMPLVGLGDYVPEPFGTSCTLDWWLAQATVGGQIFILNILFFCLLLPTAVIVFSYVKIIAKVKSSSKKVAHFDSRIHGSHMLEMKLTKTRLTKQMLNEKCRACLLNATVTCKQALLSAVCGTCLLARPVATVTLKQALLSAVCGAHLLARPVATVTCKQALLSAVCGARLLAHRRRD
ncbi:Opsin-5 [Myotis brandtii]|uniref:Opsin-5 n=1 Tax=Myotis brandtii TaxID=109478 RepID=S7MM36_MYOBR|nr:Opsin-5 [Myotis brandtii]